MERLIFNMKNGIYKEQVNTDTIIKLINEISIRGDYLLREHINFLNKDGKRLNIRIFGTNESFINLIIKKIILKNIYYFIPKIITNDFGLSNLTALKNTYIK